MWTNLIPELHRPSEETDVARIHHLLDDYNDPFSYDGKVRVVPATLAPTPTTTTTPSPMTSAVNSSGGLSVIDSSSRIKYGGDAEATTGVVRSGNDSRSLATGKDLMADAAHYSAYSTALSVTIAIGCSLLILNVLIFAGVYYQR